MLDYIIVTRILLCSFTHSLHLYKHLNSINQHRKDSLQWNLTTLSYLLNSSNLWRLASLILFNFLLPCNHLWFTEQKLLCVSLSTNALHLYTQTTRLKIGSKILIPPSWNIPLSLSYTILFQADLLLGLQTMKSSKSLAMENWLIQQKFLSSPRWWRSSLLRISTRDIEIPWGEWEFKTLIRSQPLSVNTRRFPTMSIFLLPIWLALSINLLSLTI